MTAQAAAEFIAAHAVVLLVTLSGLLLLLTGVLWFAIERWMPPLLARYLGLHALISFAAAAAGLMLFLALVDATGTDEELASFDLALAEALGRRMSPATLAAFARITQLGDPPFLTVLVAAVALLLIWRREYLLAGSWIVATAAGATLNTGLKLVFERERPSFTHALTEAHGFSFPSGHAAGSMLVYGMLAYLIVRHTPRVWHVPAVAAALLLIVFVGASRVLLHVHYFSDVLAGWAVAATWIALCVAGLEAVRLRGARPAT